MTLTLERAPATERLRASTAAVSRSTASSETAEPRPSHPRRRALRGTTLAALVACILTALIADADSAAPPGEDGPTVELEAVYDTGTKTPTPIKPPADAAARETNFGLFGSGDDRPACPAQPWSLLLCPDKPAP
ncbi:MAG TPA: hypothetical protein VFU85_09120 [Nocardioides sp.]|nr:hypothetical protein [Nocardioides sp.]